MTGCGVAVDSNEKLYRRIYRSFLMGRRINSVSLEAEATFWRLTVIADDFGNLIGTPDFVRGAAFPRRPAVTSEAISGWVDELVAHGLVERYRDGDDDEVVYLHIFGFDQLQKPLSRNGKPYRAVPVNLGNDGCKPVQTGAKQCKANHPGTSDQIRSESESESDQAGANQKSQGQPAKATAEDLNRVAGLTDLTEHRPAKAAPPARPKAENRTAANPGVTTTHPARAAFRPGPAPQAEPAPGPNQAQATTIYRFDVHRIVASIGGTADLAHRIERVGVPIPALIDAAEKAKSPRVKKPPAFLTTTLIRAGYTGLRGES